MSWGNCQRVPAVLWIVVPPLLYPATFRYFQVLWGTWGTGTWGNCMRRVPAAVLWTVVPPLLYPANQEREPGSGGKTVTTQCDEKLLFEPSIFCKQIFVGNWNQVETKISEHSGALWGFLPILMAVISRWLSSVVVQVIWMKMPPVWKASKGGRLKFDRRLWTGEY